MEKARVVDPQRAYLVVEAKLIDKHTNEVVEQWHSIDSIGDKLPFARREVWSTKYQDYLVVECVEYRLCFDDDFARRVLQRIKRQRSFRSELIFSIPPVCRKGNPFQQGKNAASPKR